MSLTPPEPFLVVDLDLGAPDAAGAVAITGGRVAGAVRGEVDPGGAGWRALGDGDLEGEARFSFRTPRGGVVEAVAQGVLAATPDIRHRLAAGEPVEAKEYYLRSFVRLATRAPDLVHLSFRLWIARGELRPGGVRLEVFEVV